MLHSRPITAEHAGPAFRFRDSGKVPRTVSLPVAQILIRPNAVIFHHIGLACVDMDRAIVSGVEAALTGPTSVSAAATKERRTHPAAIE